MITYLDGLFDNVTYQQSDQLVDKKASLQSELVKLKFRAVTILKHTRCCKQLKMALQSWPRLKQRSGKPNCLVKHRQMNTAARQNSKKQWADGSALRRWSIWNDDSVITVMSTFFENFMFPNVFYCKPAGFQFDDSGLSELVMYVNRCLSDSLG